jgi:NAD(P)-dependent dehydrogenase (short-subunit alcohol dehydrogenase family)
VRSWVVDKFKVGIENRIDLLVNNAGLALNGKEVLDGASFLGKGSSLPSASSVSGEYFEKGLAVMHHGHFALVHWLLEAGLLQPSSSRVVQVSSDAMHFGRMHPSLLSHPQGEGDMAGEFTFGCPEMGGGVLPLCVPPRYDGDGAANFGAYARAKLANVLYAQALHRRSHMWASSVMPGMVQTPMARSTAPTLLPWLEPLQEAFMTVLLRTPRTAAAVVLSAAVDVGAGGGEYVNGQGQVMRRAELPVQCHNGQVSEKLWEISERIVQRVRSK